MLADSRDDAGGRTGSPDDHGKERTTSSLGPIPSWEARRRYGVPALDTLTLPLVPAHGSASSGPSHAQQATAATGPLSPAAGGDGRSSGVVGQCRLQRRRWSLIRYVPVQRVVTASPGS